MDIFGIGGNELIVIAVAGWHHPRPGTAGAFGA